MGLKREGTATESGPNAPDSGNGRLQRCSVPAVRQGGSHTTSWGGAQNDGSFLDNAFAVYESGGGALEADLVEHQHPLNLGRCALS